MVRPRGIEPLFPPWKGDVLTARRWAQTNDEAYREDLFTSQALCVIFFEKSVFYWIIFKWLLFRSFFSQTFYRKNIELSWWIKKLLRTSYLVNDICCLFSVWCIDKNDHNSILKMFVFTYFIHLCLMLVHVNTL